MSANKSEKEEALRAFALFEGKRMARKLFDKRGNHSEMHLREQVLGYMLAVAFEIGWLEGRQGDDP